jgi:hypothetical protein
MRKHGANGNKTTRSGKWRQSRRSKQCGKVDARLVCVRARIEYDGGGRGVTVSAAADSWLWQQPYTPSRVRVASLYSAKPTTATLPVSFGLARARWEVAGGRVLLSVERHDIQSHSPHEDYR